MSRIVVIQGSIPPISGHAFVAVVFWPPPIETIDRGMLVEHRDEVGRKLTLSFFGKWIGRFQVIGVADVPGVTVACLNDHDFFVGVILFQAIDDVFKVCHGTMIVRIIGQTKDIVADVSVTF